MSGEAIEKGEYLNEPTKCDVHGFYSWLRSCPYCENESSNKTPSFDNESDAMEWMMKQVDDPYIDNERLAYTDDEDLMRCYTAAKSRGCCGEFDELIVINGRQAMIGCNFGH